ncbi:hypothetical protein BUALT_Bualt07G0132100 [Buddleja alternifolia]|uniref:Polygalacturonase n=1 Tax=Buddleja alternifolia TaxID=168488 RepID=A0AAV6XBD2_9LAMI|nr:hypothetical protein BUALT_Bualt07G0132100 [Buddleja alternifolia]
MLQGLSAYFLILCWALMESNSIRGVYAYYAMAPPPPPPPPTQDTTFDAFTSAWAAACQNVSDRAKVTVPIGKTFLLSQITFEGPCKCPNITFEILGTIVAQPRSAWKKKGIAEWMDFHGIDGLTVVGNGQGLIDGQGDSWWGHGGNRPTAMRFSHCNKLQVIGLSYKNSQKNHVSITHCDKANISSLHMIAPRNSPNTDGIDISASTNLHIKSCIMETGDDCIAINKGSSNVTISEIACGPGHGISIGSLGKNGEHGTVEAISIRNCTFNGTTNGVRIKTWQGGSGFARNINFSQINFAASDNPVIIDQFYCPHKKCKNQTSALNVSDVRYTDLRGTSICKNATISFRCSQNVPCTNIVVENVDIKSTDPHNATSAQCINAHGIAIATLNPAAFQAAWREACNEASNNPTISVSSGKTFLVSQIEFEGPCKSRFITFQVLGNIVAPPKSAWKKKSADEWLHFDKVDGLIVVGNGHGLIDGQGDSWWKQGGETSRPTVINGATISDLQMFAPSESPNTDGIDISSSTNLHIYNSLIATGDDCIAINGGTSNVMISNIACGPGHGISIGSLGKNGRHEEVEAININNCTFNRTDNGVRIKTWQGGAGFARNITFSKINFIATKNPVIIDQYYCPHKKCSTKTSAVRVSDVRYTGLHGTSIGKNPTINFSCSQTIPCTNIVLDDIDIRSVDPQKSTSARCINAHGNAHTSSPSVNCLMT